VSALDERLTRLERSVAQGAIAPAPAAPPAPREPITNLARPAAKAQSTPASAARREIANTAPATKDTPVTEQPSAPEPAPVVTTPEPAETSSDDLSFDEVAERFLTRVVPRLSRSASIFLATSQVRSFAGSTLTIAVPSEAMRASSDKIQSGLRSALEHEFRQTMQVSWIVDVSMERGGTAIADPTAPPPRPAPSRDEDVVDMNDEEIAESDDLNATSVASMLISEAFPGAEEVE